MAALPAPVVAPPWRKPFVIGLWSVAAAGAAVAMPSLFLDVAREAYRLLAAYPISLSGIAGAAVAMVRAQLRGRRVLAARERLTVPARR